MTESGSMSLELRRRLEATPAQVFDALTRPDRVKEWWCPEGYCARNVKIDLRPGGTYSIEMHSENDGDVVVVRGEYREISSPTRLVFTHKFEAASGPLLEAGLGRDCETLVVIDVKAARSATELILTKQQLPSALALKMLSGGWGGMLDKLERLTRPGKNP
jgi:uncharacterized protein YndB with AHSA1/START domain